MRRDEFSAVHPAVSFFFFAAVITVTMLYMHPVLLLISFAAASGGVCILKGARKFFKLLLGLLPFLLIVAVINALFNNAGVTPLFYFSNGNAMTAEALTYGFFACLMFSTVVLWFSSFNVVMTSDKLLYLFGALSPSLSLMLSMALRFVPRFSQKIRAIRAAREGIGLSGSGGFIKRLKDGAKVLSSTVTWALEGSVTTADSMKSRGYGTHRRTYFSLYKFTSSDAAALIAMSLLLAALIASVASGGIYARYYPSIIISRFSPLSAVGTAAFAVLCFMPHIYLLKESYSWSHSVSGI